MSPTPAISPRSNTTQQVNYERKQVSYLSASGVPQFIGSIPLNSVIISAAVSIGVPFNAATPTVTLGITPTGAEIIAAGDNTPGTAGYYAATRALGLAVTQVSPPPNIAGDPQGGTPLFLTVTQGTANAAPTGFGYVTLTYVPPLPQDAIPGG